MVHSCKNKKVKQVLEIELVSSKAGQTAFPLAVTLGLLLIDKGEEKNGSEQMKKNGDTIQGAGG